MKVVKQLLLAFFVLLLSSDIRNTLVSLILRNSIGNLSQMTLGQGILLILLFSTLFLILLFIGRKGQWLNWDDSLFSKENVKWLIYTICGASLAYASFIFIFHDSQEVLPLNSIDFWLGIGSMILIAPMAEEMVFRGILPKVIFSQHLKLSLLITGFLFILPHYPDSLVSWLDYGISAFLLSYLYYKTRRVELTIILHIFMNALVIIFG